MSRRSEQTFFQRRHTDGQQAHEKMLNITNQQGNANQNHSEISPHTYQNDYYQKGNKSQMVVSVWRKRNPSCPVGGVVNWCSRYTIQNEGFSKNKTTISSTLIYPNETQH